jgi:hypothetical protein
MKTPAELLTDEKGWLGHQQRVSNN